MKKGEFYRKKLPNGPTVLFEKRNVPVISIAAAVPFGAAYENPKFKGMAHFIEHMGFQGTKTKSDDEMKKMIENVGGYLNAFTAKESTIFYCKLPSKYIDRGMDVISDMMLNPAIKIKELEKERKVIFEEIKKCHDDPIDFSMDKIEELMYKKPFGAPILGSKQSISRIKRNDMINDHKIYCPQNMIVSIVGKANFKEIIELARKRFCIKKPQTNLNKIKVEPAHGEFIEKRAGIDQAAVVLGFHAPTSTDKLHYAARAFNKILGLGFTSRLNTEIREKRGLAYDVGSYYTNERSYGKIIADVGTKKDKVKLVKQLILKEIKKLGQLTNKELEQVKERMIGNYQLNTEESENVAIKLIDEELAGNAEDYYKYEDFVNKIKLQDVRNIAKIKNYSFTAVIPK